MIFSVILNETSKKFRISLSTSENIIAACSLFYKICIFLVEVDIYHIQKVPKKLSPIEFK